MLSVRCPIIFMAVDRGTPARSRFRTAVRRKSWGRRSGIPAFLQAVTQARRNDLMGFPARWNMHEMITPVAPSPTRSGTKSFNPLRNTAPGVRHTVGVGVTRLQ